MMSDNKLNEKAIFNVARQINSPEARREYLGQVCGADSELLARLETMLRAYAEQSSFLESPPAHSFSPTIDQSPVEKAGAVIGPYKLLQQIGEGGMGTVFMAEQTKPVQRRVALKIIKAGMDSKQVIARFEAERQALAMMDHPNIAKVLDAGATENGRPYFVMELVKGIPITKYCDEKKLGVRERLELFLPACHAIQHAHQKGIIHRDIKPSNVLVSLYDSQPVPKIIDFGVAKATANKLTEKTMFTEYGQIIGTLEYMSPEQAELNQLDIDTRTDIYSLGVLLYELLTGSTPIDRQRLKSAALDELLRIIREEEPPKPSTRLSTCETLASIAANRGAEPNKLSGFVRGDLDWIVMKALEKERSRRYENSNELAQDIERFLNEEAVHARPHSLAYKARKFVQRNRLAVLSSTAVIAAMLIGTIASSTMAIYAWRQQRETAAALQQLSEQQTETLAANREANRLAQSESVARENEGKERARADERAREAELALQVAEQERDKSKRLNDDLLSQKEQLRKTAYLGQMNLIQKAWETNNQKAWETNNFDRIRELLNATRPGPGEPDLRGLEWHYWQNKIHPAENAVALPKSLSNSFHQLSLDGKWLLAIVDPAKDQPKAVVVDAASGAIVFEHEITIGPKPPIDPSAVGNTEWKHFVRPLRVDANRVSVEVIHFQMVNGRPGTWDNGQVFDVAKLKVINRDGGELVLEATSRTVERISPFAVSRDGNRVAAAMEEPFAQVWDMKTGQELHKIPIPEEQGAPRWREIVALDSKGERIAIKPLRYLDEGKLPAGVHMIDLETGNKVDTPRFSARNIGFSHDGSRLFACQTNGDNSTVSVFDTKSGTQSAGFEINGSLDLNQCVSHDGKWLAVEKGARSYLAGEKKPAHWIEIVESTTGRVAMTIKGFKGLVGSLAFSQDSASLITLLKDGIVTWPLPLNIVSTSNSSTHSSDQTIASPDGRWRASISPEAPAVRREDSGIATADPRHILLEDLERVVENRRLPIRPVVSASYSFSLKFSLDGNLLAAISLDPSKNIDEATELKLWNTVLGKELLTLTASASKLQSTSNIYLPIISTPYIAFAPNNRRIAVALPGSKEVSTRALASKEPNDTTNNSLLPKSCVVRIWDLTADGSLAQRDTSFVVPFPCRIDFNESSDRLLVLPVLQNTKFSLRCIDVMTGRELRQHDVYSHICQTSADSSMVCSIVDERGTAYFLGWRTEDGKEVFRTPWTYEKEFSKIVVDRERHHLAIARSNDLLVFDMPTGQLKRILTHSARDVLDVAFSQDGKRIVSTYGNAAPQPIRAGNVRSRMIRNLWPAGVSTWDSETGQELLTLMIPPRHQADWDTPYAIELTDHSLKIGRELGFPIAPLSSRSQATELIGAARTILLDRNASQSEELRALHFMQEAINSAPASTETAALLALAHLRSGDARDPMLSMFPHDQMDTKFSDSNTAESHTLRALAYHFHDQPDKARDALKTARKLFSQDEILWRQLIAEVKRELAMPLASDEPEKWLGRKFMPRLVTLPDLRLPLIPIDAEGDRLIFRDGSMQSFEIVPLEEAVDYFTSALKSDEMSAERWNYRGATYHILGEVDKAMEDYTRAIGLPNGVFNDGVYLVNRGILLLDEKNEYERAIADFQKALAAIRSSDHRAHASLATAYRMTGELEKSLDSVNDAIRFSPTYGPYYCVRAYVHAASKRFDAMNADLQEAAIRSPEDRWVWLQRAWLRATSTDDAHRDGRQAIEDATKACELTHWVDETSLDHLAAAYAESGDFAKAIHWEEKAIQLCPAAKRSKFELRRELYKQNKPYREPLIRTQPN